MITNAIAQRDPTQTINLRRQFAAAARRRWRALWEALGQAIANGLLGPEGYLDNDLLRSFMDWFRGETRRLLLETDSGEPGAWLLPFMRSAFLRGVGHADRSAGQAGLTVLPVETFNIFLYQSELDALWRQAVADLERIIQATGDQVQGRLAEVLTGGLMTDLSNEEFVSLIADRINKIGLTRSVTMAATSVVGTVAEATLTRLVAYGVRTVSPLLEWVTAIDPCPICIGLRDTDNGLGPGIYTIEQARGLIPAHPRCRCRWLPVFEPVQANVRRARHGASVVY